MIELIAFLLVTVAIVVWWQLMQGRQKARQAADHVCKNHDLQLLDDTVALSSIRWHLDGKEVHILVNYGFEFATDGAVRRSGVASFGLPGSMTVTLELEEGRLIEDLHQL